MKQPLAATPQAHRAFVALFAVLAVAASSIASSIASGGAPPGGPGSSRSAGVTLAQNTAPATAPQPAAPVPSAQPSGALAWTFDTAQPSAGAGWTAERGTLTPGSGEARLQPDRNRRVVLVSPPDLPDAARDADAFVLGLAGTGLERVHVQARRDPRGGWITIADGKGAGLRATPSGIALKRTAGSRDQPIESLRVELSFRTTNPRPLTGIAAVPAPR